MPYSQEVYLAWQAVLEGSPEATQINGTYQEQGVRLEGVWSRQEVDDLLNAWAQRGYRA